MHSNHVTKGLFELAIRVHSLSPDETEADYGIFRYLALSLPITSGYNQTLFIQPELIALQPSLKIIIFLICLF